MSAPDTSFDGVQRVVCAGGLVPKAESSPERWAYIRIARNLDTKGRMGGGTRLSPLHADPGCPHLNRGWEGDGSEIIRVLLENCEGHPILGLLGNCKWCTERTAVIGRMQAWTSRPVANGRKLRPIEMTGESH